MNKTLTLEDIFLLTSSPQFSEDFPEQIGEQDSEIVEACKLFDDCLLSPSDASINRLIMYSRSLAVLEIEEPSLRLMNQN